MVAWFRGIFRVHRGQKTVNVAKKGRRLTCRFSDDLWGHIFVICGAHFGALWHPKIDKIDVKKTTKNKGAF